MRGSDDLTSSKVAQMACGLGAIGAHLRCTRQKLGCLRLRRRHPCSHALVAELEYAVVFKTTVRAGIAGSNPAKRTLESTRYGKQWVPYSPRRAVHRTAVRHRCSPLGYGSFHAYLQGNFSISVSARNRLSISA